LDESCNSKPKSEISNWTKWGQARKADKTSARPHFVQFEISDFGFELQDSSNLRFPQLLFELVQF